MKHHKAIWPIAKRANRGFRGHPVGTVSFYGPDDRRASKVAAGILASPEDEEATLLERWFSDDDVRDDPAIADAILSFFQTHGAKTIVMDDRIIGCPHEEGIDYPIGEKCPTCPFWAPRDRHAGLCAARCRGRLRYRDHT